MALRRLVSVCGWAAVLFAVLGFAASIGHGPLPPLPAGSAIPLAVLLLLAGAAAAWAAERRGAEIDRERFGFVEDPLITADERKLAHQEAERQHKLSTMALVGAPLALGYWLAYELPAELRWAPAIPVAALVGYATAALALRRRSS